LIVEDSAVIRSVVKKSIGMSGLEVKEIHEAASGRQALEVLAGRWIDIVFADHNMPEMNGTGLGKKMAEDSLLVSIPGVVVSSERNQDRIDELKQLGIRAYLRKPFRPESFRDVVQDVLGPATPGGQA